MTLNVRFNPGDTVYLVHENYQAIEAITVERVTLKYVNFLANGEQSNYDWRNDNPYLRYRVSHHLGLRRGTKFLYFRDSGMDELEIRSTETGFHLFVSEDAAKEYLCRI